MHPFTSMLILLLACVEALPTRRTYKVTVKTSAALDAGSSPHDKVFIKLSGDKHTTEYKELKGDENAFQRNTYVRDHNAKKNIKKNNLTHT